jgi:hypothetical protein
MLPHEIGYENPAEVRCTWWQGQIIAGSAGTESVSRVANFGEDRVSKRGDADSAYCGAFSAALEIDHVCGRRGDGEGKCYQDYCCCLHHCISFC